MSNDPALQYVKAPTNPKIQVWRYMDFTKFVSLFENTGLFFSRADYFDDPFEGAYPHTSFERYRSTLYAGHKELGTPSEDIEKIFRDGVGSLVDLLKEYNQWMMISCWHMNEYESAAMWKLYAKSNEAICVQSTYERLRACLDSEVYIGEVQYIDYQKDWLPSELVLYPFLHKRKSFEHERELRALVWRYPIDKRGIIDTNALPPEGGIWKKIDLDQLIEKIYVAPYSPNWFYDLVQKICARYEFRKPVVRSSLEEKPSYLL